MQQTLVHVDDGSENGLVDALIHYPDASTAALEITTVPAPEAEQMESFDIHLDVPESPSWWDVRYPGVSLNRRESDRHIPALISRLDSLGLDEADLLAGSIEGSPEWLWYVRTGVNIRRLHARPEGGRVAILTDASGGAIDSSLQGLAAWVEGVQAEPWWIENVNKLARSPHREKHLAVVMHEAVVPFSIAQGLWDATTIESPDPTGMSPLTDLWLLPRWGRTVARWSAGKGWSSHVYEQR